LSPFRSAPAPPPFTSAANGLWQQYKRHNEQTLSQIYSSTINVCIVMKLYIFSTDHIVLLNNRTVNVLPPQMTMTFLFRKCQLDNYIIDTGLIKCGVRLCFISIYTEIFRHCKWRSVQGSTVSLIEAGSERLLVPDWRYLRSKLLTWTYFSKTCQKKRNGLAVYKSG
jgi:hypothetical protein